jgi:hypothetical protein
MIHPDVYIILMCMPPLVFYTPPLVFYTLLLVFYNFLHASSYIYELLDAVF